MNTPSSLFGNLLLFWLSTAIMLVGAELFFKFLVPASPSLLFLPFEAHMRQNQFNDFLGVVSSDPELFWKLTPGTVLPDNSWPIRGIIANRKGLREDHEIPYDKPPGSIRILFLGDSCTFGFGTLHHQSIVEQVETLITRRFPGVPVEAINAGVPGYSLFQGWRVFETIGEHYRPDLIVVTFGWNDSKTWANRTDLQHFEEMQASRPPSFLLWSALSNQLWKVVSAHRNKDLSQENVPRVPPEEFDNLLSRLHASAQAQQIDMFIMVWPIQFNLNRGRSGLSPYQKAMYRFGKEVLKFGPEQSEGVLDLIPIMENAITKHAKNELYVDSVHTSSLGNSLIAEALVDKISGWYAVKYQNALKTGTGN